MISGRLQYDGARTASSSPSNPGLQGVAIVLQDLSTQASGQGLAVITLTDGNGAFQFNGVPTGNYQLVESFGTPTTYTAAVDWSSATMRPIINGGTTPPISFASPHAPASATHLDCTIRNTFLLTVGADNITQDFLNGPVRYTPMDMPSFATVSDNLVTVADDGTVGKWSTGTVANTGAPEYTGYESIQSQFIHTMPNPNTVTPNDGYYTIQNIMNNSHSNGVGTWWRIADHTTGNETGRMMVINGDTPGKIIGMTTIGVRPNTNYLSSWWILNLCKINDGTYANPSFKVIIYGEDGITQLYNHDLGADIPINPDCPEWKQIGTVLFTGDNNEITIAFISTGPAATGNDYALDDVALNEIATLNVIKESCPFAAVGGTLYYAVTIQNPTTLVATEVLLRDAMPSELDDVQYSLDSGSSWQSWAGELGLDNIEPSDSVTVLLRGQVTDRATTTITNSASVDVTFCTEVENEQNN